MFWVNGSLVSITARERMARVLAAVWSRVSLQDLDGLAVKKCGTPQQFQPAVDAAIGVLENDAVCVAANAKAVFNAARFLVEVHARPVGSVLVSLELVANLVCRRFALIVEGSPEFALELVTDLVGAAADVTEPFQEVIRLFDGWQRGPIGIARYAWNTLLGSLRSKKAIRRLIYGLCRWCDCTLSKLLGTIAPHVGF